MKKTIEKDCIYLRYINLINLGTWETTAKYSNLGQRDARKEGRCEREKLVLDPKATEQRQSAFFST
jgi:hypothetical protein